MGLSFEGVTFKFYANEQEAFDHGYTETGRVKGFYRYPSGTSGLFRGSLDSLQDTLETLRHETLAHFGLNLLAHGDKAVLLGDIIAAKGNKAIDEAG
jgi:hypothetical protein